METCNFEKINLNIFYRLYILRSRAENTPMERFEKIYILTEMFTLGGAGYGALEIGYRGETHWSMIVCGGVCFLILCAIAKMRKPVFVKCLLGGLAITGVEFLTGLIVNLGLGLDVWSYADMPLNILGQVCPRYFVLWCFLCFPFMVILKGVRYGNKRKIF